MFPRDGLIIHESGTCDDVDGGVKGTGGSWTSYCDMKNESKIPEPLTRWIA